MFEPVQRIVKVLKPRTAALGATLLFAGIGGSYSFLIYNRIIKKDQTYIRSEFNVPDSFKNSYTIRSLVNPYDHVTMGDSHSIVLAVDPRREEPSEEALLCAFVNGFFSGLVFMPERIALRLLGLCMVKFEGLAAADIQQNIWSTSQLSETQLPWKTAMLWGCFQVANIELSSYTDDSHTESIIDLVFGNNQGQFAGCHRFSIKRLETNSSIQRDEKRFQIRLESIVCNPTVNKLVGISFLRAFHNKYSTLLFGDAVAEVKHRLDLPIL